MYLSGIPASNFVEGVDRAFAVIFGISLFFLVGITIVMIYFLIRYSRKRNPVPTQIEGSTMLEIVWTIIPLALVMVMFFYGFKGYVKMREAPEDAMNVKVTAYMWDWEFQYENGKKSRELFVPLNKPVRLNMESLDVIHSLYIPSFRIKEDIVPGTTNMMWFIAEQEGSYKILCAEYCGLRHSYMETNVKVLVEENFNQWLADYNPDEDKEPLGLEIIKKNACVGCHSLDGSKLVGPSFKGIYGTQREVVENGVDKTVTADEDYIKSSVISPNDQIVKGYQGNLMQSYEKLLSEEDIKAVADYLKKLK